MIEGLPKGEQCAIPPPSMSSVGIANNDPDGPVTKDDRVSLYLDDPWNFLKLCSALRILIKWRITDLDIDQADHLVCEYCTELILVRCS